MQTLRSLLVLLAVPYVIAICPADHTCYTQTLTTKNIGTECPPLTGCGLHADCFLITTTTISEPPVDRCCKTTPTSLVPGPCPTCQVGCGESIETVFTTVPTPTAATLYKDSVETITPCTTTLFRVNDFTFGPTSTVYTSTVTETSGLQCQPWCEIVTKNIGGVGPVAIFTTTITATVPETTTTFTCGF